MSGEFEITPKELSDEEMGIISGGSASIYITQKNINSLVAAYQCNNPAMQSVQQFKKYAVDMAVGCENHVSKYATTGKYSMPANCLMCIYFKRYDTILAELTTAQYKPNTLLIDRD